MRIHRHHLVTPEIHRELDNALHRGQKPPPDMQLGGTAVSPTTMEEDVHAMPKVLIMETDE